MHAFERPAFYLALPAAGKVQYGIAQWLFRLQPGFLSYGRRELLRPSRHDIYDKNRYGAPSLLEETIGGALGCCEAKSTCFMVALVLQQRLWGAVCQDRDK